MSINDITGDKLKSKPNTDTYRTNYDKIKWNNQPSPKRGSDNGSPKR